ncbi:cell envelope integrity protein CreD [Aliikangiella sp. G2MR2-5]|uniref:cell envelope integrity protein CreD n=1 Tax=Aliikangiella sp. G2MR2-5 TaxID=2788943 RepID=UPI0018ABFE6E|nr:cell envelope integrity protein CreD [Aliikangiella sp. G2MR2-5]
MKSLLTNKYLWLLFIIFALNIPLEMIEHQVEERSMQRDTAKTSVARSWTGAQKVLGPLLVIPYEQKSNVRIALGDGTFKTEERWHKVLMPVAAESQSSRVNIRTQTLKKGIYPVPVYTSLQDVNASFNLESVKAFFREESVRRVEKAYLSFGVEDVRGILGKPKLSVNQEPTEVEPGSNLTFFPSGVNATVEDKLLTGKLIEVVFSLELKGMEALEFIPLGKSNFIEVNSDWPHPNFIGTFLPTEREINTQGYSAQWQTGIFATDIVNVLERCMRSTCENGLIASQFGVRHIQAVDIYLQTLRSVKYGILTIVVTFAIFLLYELVTRKASIHPVAYALTGFSLAIFFLLLLALSEHLTFIWAYWSAALSCTLLIGYYVRHQTQSVGEGAGIFVVLNLFFLVLYFIIGAEDYALLSGSFLLFVLLATIMFVTRKVDWYRLSPT